MAPPRATFPLALAGALLALACAAPASAAGEGSDPELAALRRDLAEVKAVVAEVRGLPFLREVAVAIERNPAPDSRTSGFYRVGSDTVTVSDLSPIARPFLLAHELAHALQDQHYDLARVERGVKGGDRLLALNAAIEGEAHLVALAYALRRSGLDRVVGVEDLPLEPPVGRLAYRAAEAFGLRRRPPGLPPARRDPFLFPYIEGLAFAQAVVKASGHGLPGLDGVLLDPPRSTEQVLHPEKYLAEARDDPIAVRLPPPPAGGPSRARLVRSETAGEWRIRAELEERLPIGEARRAAAGWGGDVRALYERAGERFEVFATVWDTARDAGEFAAAAAAFARAEGSGATIERGPGPLAVTIRRRTRPAATAAEPSPAAREPVLFSR